MLLARPVRPTPLMEREVTMDCILCKKYPSRLFESKYFFVIYDDFPVREGHLLIVPKRHVEDMTDLLPMEFNTLHRLLQEMVKRLKVDFQADGYNLGINGGEAAGQTVSHLHIHLLPRIAGDVPDPRGGIRNFLPNPLTNYP
jgi:diadenosine tetraphosphate (Ap4A) HIT family hydrolase